MKSEITEYPVVGKKTVWIIKPRVYFIVYQLLICIFNIMKRALLILLLILPQSVFSQTFYGDTIWMRDYSSAAGFSCAFSPDGATLAVAYECMGPMVRVLDVDNGHILWESQTPDLCLYNLQFSSNGQYIAIAEELGQLVVVDITIPDTIYSIETLSGGLRSVDFSPNGDYIYAGGNDGTVRIFETVTGMLHHTIPAHMDAVMAVDVSQTGRYIATGSKDNMVRVWDVDNNYQMVYEWMDHMDDVKTVKFTPDENRLLTGSADDMINVYWMPNGSLDTTLEIHGADVNVIDVSADGSFMVSGSNDQSAKMINLHNYNSVFTYTNLWQTRVYGLSISPDMTKLATSNHIGYVILYDIQAMIGTEEYETSNIHIYPNPTTDFVFISNLTEEVNYEILQVNGQVIKTGITNNYVNVADLHSGIYILRLGNSYCRFVKQ